MNANPCNCCKAPSGGTPLVVHNRPGLTAIAYRVGTFANFRQAMCQAIARSPALRHLTTRRGDDHGITLIELWAAVADILTFYQERIANEAFLRTATRRDAVLRMARMLGYELAPGSAATAFLSFTVEKGKQVRIPVGLRVQSVPGQDEKPQKYETMETITASGWLTQLKVYPAPVGTNPLAKGVTSAYLAAGDEGLRMAASLTVDDRLLLFAPGAKTPVETILVVGIETENEHVRLRWQQPVQGASWSMTTRVQKRVRTFRLFGCNAPAQYPKPILDASNVVTAWRMQDIGTDSAGSDSFAVDSVTELDLDGRYDDIKVGAPLLLEDGASAPQLLTVTAVGQNECRLGPLTDTVTKLTVSPTFARIGDRRKVVIHELAGPAISFWGYDYPETIASGSLYVPGRRIDGDTVEIARPIAEAAYQAGDTVKLNTIETGRRVMLRGEGADPLPASIRRAYIRAAQIVVDATAQDAETVRQLRLDKTGAVAVTGLCSSRLTEPLTFSNSPLSRNITIAINITIAEMGPRTLSATMPGPLTLADAAAGLQSLIRSADPDPAFAHAVVLACDDRLLVFPGVAGASVVFEKTDQDESTVVKTGLDRTRAKTITGLVSGKLSGVPAYTETAPRVAVRIGPVGPVDIALDSGADTLDDIAQDLQAKLNAADPAPFFRYARVKQVGQRLLVLPGVVGAAHRDFLELQLSLDAAICLPRRSTELLGNIASASHGETVSNEVLGDADPSIAFQRFPLKKHPVTFVPSGGATANTLHVSVNGIRWQEVPTLYGQGPTETVYTTRIDDDGSMTVGFGDGVTGARPPKGRANVTAAYRQGLGLAGRVRANTVKTLLDKPKGLKSVINPGDADGGADPESLQNARQNAPTTVRTFDRIVSLRDFEYAALGGGEIAKARATRVWSRAVQAVHLTVAAQCGARFSAAALERIHAGLTAKRDPNRLLLLDNYRPIPIRIAATVQVAAHRTAATVVQAARVKLLEALSFDALDLGRSVHLSDLYAVLQQVPGVVSVDIDQLGFKQPTTVSDGEFLIFLNDRGTSRRANGSIDPVQGHLRIHPARPNPGTGPSVLAAEQAWIENPGQDIILISRGGLPDSEIP